MSFLNENHQNFTSVSPRNARDRPLSKVTGYKKQHLNPCRVIGIFLLTTVSRMAVRSCIPISRYIFSYSVTSCWDFSVMFPCVQIFGQCHCRCLSVYFHFFCLFLNSQFTIISHHFSHFSAFEVLNWFRTVHNSLPLYKSEVLRVHVPVDDEVVYCRFHARLVGVKKSLLTKCTGRSWYVVWSKWKHWHPSLFAAWRSLFT
jgi:hypothetical protein